MWKVSFLWDGKFAYQLLNSGKFGKFMYQLQLEVEIFEVCKSTKEVMESEGMFATAENEKQGF